MTHQQDATASTPLPSTASAPETRSSTPAPDAGREIELKFHLTKSAFKAAQAWDRLGTPSQPPRARRLRSVYFDTEAGDLARQNCALRVRSVNRRHLLTFKWPGTFAGGAFERGEAEVPCPSEALEPALLGPDIAALLEAICQGRPLQPVFATDVKRLTHRLHPGASAIEIAFDSGLILAGDQTLPICEIELELKSGQAADLYALGISLADSFPVTLGVQSKSERGALLRSGLPPAIIQAPRSAAPAATVDSAIGLALNNCLQHFLGNWPAFHAGDPVKAIHQMRVAMRRLRAILSVFHRAFPCPEFAQFRQEAKDIATAMGDARNFDVFIALINEGPRAAFPDDPGLALLLQDAHQHRAAGYAAVQALLADPRTTRFVLSLQSFIARHGWRNGLSGEILPILTASPADFFAANLARIHRKIRKNGRKFALLPAVHRHELRKELKKLRYLAEFFADLCDTPASHKTYLRTLATLQDQLGLFNDFVTAQEMVETLHTNGDPAAIRAIGIIIGWCGRSAATDDRALLKAWHKFRKLERTI